MLRPYKHAHPDKTVVALAATLLKRLKEQRLSNYEALLEFAHKKVGSESASLFLPALNLLYLLGLVEYHRKTDAIEYVGQ